MKGRVKWFNGQKGYGFIEPDDKNAGDVFVHISEIERSGLHSLADGQKVSFETELSKKSGKMQAVRLELAD